MEDDGDEKDDSKRRTRNLSEKKRRDQFNLLINELSSLVTTSNRKMDKSTVLKSTIAFLKNHNEITVRSRAHDIQDDWKPTFLSNEEFTYLILEALEGFVVVFSTSGRIHYVSESISSLLGHNPADIINKSLYELVFEDDQQTLYSFLQNPGNITDLTHTGKEKEVQFRCHIRRGGSVEYGEDVAYELIQFNGHCRSNVEPLHADDLSHYRQGNDNRLLFVCTGRLSNPQLIRDVSLVDSSRSEFSSRHSLEWKFLFLDRRAPPIIGYLPFEVLGTSGYDYYHFDDLEKVITCHEVLMQKGELTSCYYRFLTKGQQWIWLQTRFYITYHQWNSKPEFIVCTHRVVSYADMEKDMKQEGAEVEVMSDADLNRSTIEDATAENPVVPVSPSYVSEGSDQYMNSYQPLSQPASVKSTSAGSTTGTASTVHTVSTTAVSWSRAAQPPYAPSVSDTASISGESRSSVRNNSHDEQLQRKHEELQQMIVRQQEELRQVKEQLLLARLGILQPINNVNPIQNSYVNREEAQENPQLPAPPQEYNRNGSRGNTTYQQQHTPNPDRNNLPQ